MLRVIIVDDDLLAIKNLSVKLQKHFPGISVIDTVNSVADGVKAIRKHNPDLVICDIEMPEISGIDLLKFFNEDEITFDLIFATSHSSFAVQAFQLSAVDYLLKPLDEELLRKAIIKVINKQSRVDNTPLKTLKQNLIEIGKEKIVLPLQEGFQILLINDILYLKAENAYTEFVIQKDKKILVSKNIKVYEEMLKPMGFMRVHRSFLINLSYVTSFLKSEGGTVVLDNKIEIPVSSEKKDSLIDFIKGI